MIFLSNNFYLNSLESVLKSLLLHVLVTVILYFEKNSYWFIEDLLGDTFRILKMKKLLLKVVVLKCLKKRYCKKKKKKENEYITITAGIIFFETVPHFLGVVLKAHTFDYSVFIN